jgi:hypothetical protein
MSRDGNDIWVRSVQPHPRLGISTTTTFTVDEAVLAFEKVQTTRHNDVPIAKTKVTLANSSKWNPGDVLFESINSAISFSKKNNLGVYYKNGVKNFLPKDSLSPFDLERDPQSVFARLCSIAHEMGTPKIVSRISSQPVKLTVYGATNLSEWWTHSSLPQKILLFSRTKHFQTNEKGWIGIKPQWNNLFRDIPCPFRDAEAQVGHKEGGSSAEEEIPQGESSDDELTFEEAGGISF